MDNKNIEYKNLNANDQLPYLNNLEDIASYMDCLDMDKNINDKERFKVGNE